MVNGNKQPDKQLELDMTTFLGGPRTKTTDFTTSSTILTTTYDTVTNTLRVTFKNGRTYEYTGITGDIYDALVNAPSAGSYFNSMIKSRPNKRIV